MRGSGDALLISGHTTACARCVPGGTQDATWKLHESWLGSSGDGPAEGRRAISHGAVQDRPAIRTRRRTKRRDALAERLANAMALRWNLRFVPRRLLSTTVEDRHRYVLGTIAESGVAVSGMSRLHDRVQIGRLCAHRGSTTAVGSAAGTGG